jgi:hypothetical protein
MPPHSEISIVEGKHEPVRSLDGGQIVDSLREIHNLTIPQHPLNLELEGGSWKIQFAVTDTPDLVIDEHPGASTSSYEQVCECGCDFDCLRRGPTGLHTPPSVAK